MEIRSAADINADVARSLRKRAGMIQKVFWNRVGVGQPGGWKYEHGLSPIPKPIRLLLFIQYVAGIDIECMTEEGAARIVRLGQQYSESHC